MKSLESTKRDSVSRVSALEQELGKVCAFSDEISKKQNNMLLSLNTSAASKEDVNRLSQENENAMLRNAELQHTCASQDTDAKKRSSKLQEELKTMNEEVSRFKKELEVYAVKCAR